MSFVVKKEFIITLTVSIILSFSFMAMGQEAEEKELEEVEVEEIEEDTMLNIMPFLKIPKRPFAKYSFVQEFEYLDNYYLSEGDRSGRFASISSPVISLKYPIGRAYLEGEYKYGFTYYIGKDEEAHRHSASVKLYHRLTKRFSVGLSDEFTRNDQPDQQGDIDVKVAGKTFNRNTLRAQAKYEINRRLRCGVDGGYNFLYFKERPSLASPDKADFSFGGNLEYMIDPRTGVGIHYEFSDELFKESDSKDSSAHSIQLRYSHNMRKVLTVGVHGGCDVMNYEGGEDVTSMSAGTDLGFDISRLTNFALGYDYGFESSSREDYLAYKGHTFHANIGHNLTPRLAVNANTSCDIWGYDSKYDISGSSSKSDKESYVIRFGCGLNYKFTKKIDIGAVYNTSAKFSDFADDEYFSNHYLLTIRGTF